MKVALVHDWLTGMRGGEYVLEAIAELFPKADLFTLLYVPGKISPLLTTLPRKTSWLQKIPGAENRYRHFLPLMPNMIESFDLTGYDLIISSSHCVAKGIRKPKGSIHISYVHAPMRYMWDRYEDYFGAGRSSLPVRLAAKLLQARLQKWDRSVSSIENVDFMIANSRFIADKIKKHYGRDSEVIHPFSNLSRFEGKVRRSGSNYLMVTAFAPYKRVDLAVQAFDRLKLPLIIVGSGQDKERLQKISGDNIDFLGHVSNRVIDDLYSKCRAFIFPGVEDFGITPLESMASGLPVIAYNDGGAVETITSKTGLLFEPQTVESLMEAVSKFEKNPTQLDPEDCRARAREFSKDVFQKKFRDVVSRVWKKNGRDSQELDF